jgi:hypothetical protein
MLAKISFREMFLVRVALVEKLERALKQFVYVLFAGFVWCEKLVEIKVWESAVCDTGRKKLPQTSRFNRSEVSNFLEHHALQRILKYSWIEQMTDLQSSPALDQYRAKEPQRISLQLGALVWAVTMHGNSHWQTTLNSILCKTLESQRQARASKRRHYIQ